ncbi:MAG: hypothetical protein HOY79_34135 [Streptomyces sp.]|nr:hypothetical protein [Streptomyces sp.]NUS11402.1 hypothetical protein [Streptomyces sp.]NUS23457.1 hypothetical protein [Streptomyces sp.]
MPKSTHTTIKEIARELRDAEGLTYAEAQRVAARWVDHQPPTEEELTAADEEAVKYDPLTYYAMQPGSEIPGWMFGREGYPVRAEAPAPYCYTRPVRSLAHPEQVAALSLFARPTVYRGEAALIIEPLTYFPPADTRLPGYGHWGNCWSVEVHELGLHYNRVSHLAAPGWTATVTRGAELSAPVRLRLAHADGYVLFDADAALPPDWLARVRVHPEGIPVFCGPGAGMPIPVPLDDEEADLMLQTADLNAGRVPFTVREA